MAEEKLYYIKYILHLELLVKTNEAARKKYWNYYEENAALNKST